MNMFSDLNNDTRKMVVGLCVGLLLLCILSLPKNLYDLATEVPYFIYKTDIVEANGTNNMTNAIFSRHYKYEFLDADNNLVADGSKCIGMRGFPRWKKLRGSHCSDLPTETKNNDDYIAEVQYVVSNPKINRLKLFSKTIFFELLMFCGVLAAISYYLGKFVWKHRKFLENPFSKPK